jgi:hypothetical protein
MLHLELPTWLLHSGHWPPAVTIQPDGHVIAEFVGKGGPDYPSWSLFCADYDADVAPDVLFDELKDQIDPDILTVAERGRGDVDAIVTACGQAAAR